MAAAITFITQRQKEVLLIPQGSQPLHKGLQGPKGANRGAYMEREAAKVCEKGGI